MIRTNVRSPPSNASRLPSSQTDFPPELCRNLVQVASTIPHCLRDALPWYAFSPPQPGALTNRPPRRYLHNLHAQLLQQHLQDPLHLLLGLHALPDDDSLQTHAICPPRHLPRAIPPPRRLRPSRPFPARIHHPRDPLELQHLARERGDPAAAVHAAAHRRGGHHHRALYCGAGHLPRAVHPELDLAVLVGWASG